MFRVCLSVCDNSKTYKTHKSNDSHLSHFGLIEEIMRRSHKKLPVIMCDEHRNAMNKINVTFFIVLSH